MASFSIVIGAMLLATSALANVAQDSMAQDAPAPTIEATEPDVVDGNLPAVEAEAPPEIAGEAPQIDPAPIDEAGGFDLARVKIAGCPGERFEFQTADQGAEGTKVQLCSDAGATKDEIAAMLTSAIEQLESTDRMSATNRDQILAQIRAKLIEVEARSAQ